MVFKEFTPAEKMAYAEKQAALKGKKPFTKGKAKPATKGKKPFNPNYK